MAVVEVTDATFQSEVVGSDKPVLVDCWADWCMPCKAIAPSLDQLSDEMAEQITITKLNVDQNQATAQGLNVRNLPTLMIFKGGATVAMLAGAQPKSSIKSWIERTI